MNDDRIKSQDADKKLPKPEVYIVKDGDSVFKPGMKTYFVDSKDDSSSSSESSGSIHTGKQKTITETVCVCNKVCTCNPQCSCENDCSCDSVCSCNSVCTCESNCSCNSVCTCESNYSSGGSYTYCSCVPVH